MITDVMAGVHSETTRLDLHEVVRRLNNHLGATLVAALAGSRDSKAPYKWAKVGGSMPRAETEERLRAAHRIWQMISDSESETTARAWFIGLNPVLGEVSPIMALREGRTRETLLAAQAFLDGSWSA